MAPSQLLADYESHIARMFILTGESIENSKEIANSIVQFETALANASLPLDQIRDPYSVYNKLDVQGLMTKIAPDLDWYMWMAGINHLFTQLNIAEPSFFKAINTIIPQTDPDTLRNYIRWQLLHTASDYLSSAFVNETFLFFGNELGGQDELAPRSKRCLTATGDALGDILAKYYVEDMFSPQAKNITNAMIDQIMLAFKNDLNSLTWMDDKTRLLALLKLREVSRRVAYPDTFNDYSYFQPIQNQFLFSVLESRMVEFNRSFSQVDGPFDRYSYLPLRLLNKVA
jgi:predicted metalloendopeptidase